MRSRSVATTCSMSGRSTLTATVRPSSRRARCTTAMEAVPIGSGSNSANASRSDRPRSSSTRWRTSGNGTGGPGVEAGPELVGHVVAEHAGRRRDDLAELHEGPAEVLEALAQRPGQLGRRQRALADGAQLAEGRRGEVDRHHLGDGPAPAQQLAVRRIGQAPRVDPRHVLGQRARRRGRSRLCLHLGCRANRCVRRALGSPAQGRRGAAAPTAFPGRTATRRSSPARPGRPCRCRRRSAPSRRASRRRPRSPWTPHRRARPRWWRCGSRWARRRRPSR